MSVPQVQSESATVILGCDPQIMVTITNKGTGALFFELSPADGSAAADIDIDGFFFSFAAGSSIMEADIYPDPDATNAPEMVCESGGRVTDFGVSLDGENSLENGAKLAQGYDAKVQFGTGDNGTAGDINSACFTLNPVGSDTISLDDIDLSELAVVINSDTDDGMVLTPTDGNDGDDDGDDGGTGEEPGTCTFTIEGDVNTQIILTEDGHGGIEVSVDVLAGDDEDATGQVGDIRGLFFDLQDPKLADGISVTGDDVTDSMFSSDGSVSDLGNGANVSGGGRDGFDGGVEFGHQGLRGGNDDIQETVFTLSHPGGQSLEDFAGSNFALRLTSVGEQGSDREESLKLEGQCPEGDTPPPPEDDCGDQYPLQDVMTLFLPPVADEFPPTDYDDPESPPDFLDAA